MRWDNLFDDLESQLEHELGVEELELRVEEERLRLGRLTLRSRLRAVSGVDRPRTGGSADRTARAVRLWLADGSVITVRPTTFGRDWLSGEFVVGADAGDTATGQGRFTGADGATRTSRAPSRVLVPLHAVASVGLDDEVLADSLDSEADQDASPGPAAVPRLIDRLGFAFALRDLARRRAAITITTRFGSLHGTIDRVAKDHFDLALHDAGTPRRECNVRGTRLVPLDVVVLVRV